METSLPIVLVLTGALASAADRRNNLIISTDDQSSRTASCYYEASPWVDTPNIDSLAAEGVRLSQAYIGSWCLASRATMLTVHHQHGIESMHIEEPYPDSAYAPEKCRLWPDVFREQGYHTAQIGKWYTSIDPPPTFFAHAGLALPRQTHGRDASPLFAQAKVP